MLGRRMTRQWVWHTWVYLDGINRVFTWRHYERDGVSNYQRFDCLLNRLFKRRSKKTSKLRVTGLCEGNSPVTDEFPAQRANNAENVSISWRHHGHRRQHRFPIRTHSLSYGIHFARNITSFLLLGLYPISFRFFPRDYCPIGVWYPCGGHYFERWYPFAMDMLW